MSMKSRRTAYAILAIICSGLSCGRVKEAPEMADRTERFELAPTAVIYRTPGYPGPDEPLDAGVVAAIRDDMSFILSKHDPMPGPPFYTGTLDAASYEGLGLEEAQEVNPSLSSAGQPYIC